MCSHVGGRPEPGKRDNQAEELARKTLYENKNINPAVLAPTMLSLSLSLLENPIDFVGTDCM